MGLIADTDFQVVFRRRRIPVNERFKCIVAARLILPERFNHVLFRLNSFIYRIV